MSFRETVQLLESINLEALKPGEKMVFGKVKKVAKGGRMEPQVRWKKQRHRKRQRATGSKKGYTREVGRAQAHVARRGVKKQRGMKEAMYALLANLSEQDSS